MDNNVNEENEDNKERGDKKQRVDNKVDEDNGGVWGCQIGLRITRRMRRQGAGE